MLEKNIRIVLIETTHPGNIGAVARAMKTMGLTQLYLVAPRHFPHSDAVALAAGADDILDQATVCADFDMAITDCRLIIGTSARQRYMPWPLLNPHQCGEKIVAEAAQYPVALVFGQERAGMSNEQLAKCHFHVQIPANPDYSSLNIAAAVQVLCYEIRVALLQAQDNNIITNEPINELATLEESEYFYRHLEQTLTTLEFIKTHNRETMMLRLRRLFQRARLEKTETNILRGILTTVQDVIKK